MSGCSALMRRYCCIIGVWAEKSELTPTSTGMVCAVVTAAPRCSETSRPARRGGGGPGTTASLELFGDVPDGGVERQLERTRRAHGLREEETALQRGEQCQRQVGEVGAR